MWLSAASLALKQREDVARMRMPNGKKEKKKKINFERVAFMLIIYLIIYKTVKIILKSLLDYLKKKGEIKLMLGF